MTNDATIRALERLASGSSAQSDGPTVLRRWDSAETSRLNTAHWSKATGAPINSDLSADWETLVTRIAYERANNPILEGVVETHVADVVGPTGPQLQVHSDSRSFNQWLESHWARWWSAPDIEERLSGPDMIDLWVRMLWTTGEFLFQVVNDSQADTPVQMRVAQIHPRRLVTPAGQFNNAIVLGVERSAEGKPVTYWIQEAPENEGWTTFFGVEHPVPASLIHHEFRTIEPGQARGVPWAASALQTIADIRDGDAQILDAIRAAADSAILLETNHDDAPWANVAESVDVERRRMETLPPGWTAKQMVPQQPHTNYIEYRNERLREVGAPIAMPLLKIMRSSKGHNFSQSKFDGQTYFFAGVQKLRCWLERRTLRRLVNTVEFEARLAEMMNGLSVPKPPARVDYVWRWPKMPSPDPFRDAQATLMLRSIGALALDDILSEQGKTVEQHAAKEIRDRQTYKDTGLPYPEPEMLIQMAKAGLQSDLEVNADGMSEPSLAGRGEQ